MVSPVTNGVVTHGLVVIGNFDGVHRGHQAVIARAAETARHNGLVARVLTFHPHPAEVLGRTPPALLTTLDRKRELIARASPEVELVVMKFDASFAAQSPEEFARRITLPPLHAKYVVVGKNFRFGKGRAGDFATLTDLGRRMGFEAHSQELLGDGDGPWSSTRIRAAIAAGDAAEAERMLGRPHMVSGRVEQGDRRGRTIGFPTANLVELAEAAPAQGVYAVLVDVVEDDQARNLRRLGGGAANLGVRPTVGGDQLRLEVHVLDFDGDLYGRLLRVHFVARIRGEQRFSGLDALRAQIGRDVAEARRVLSTRAASGRD